MEKLQKTIQEFLAQEPEKAPLFISQLKAQGRAFFEENGFPSPKEEAWRSTDFSAFTGQDFEIPTQEDSSQKKELKCHIPDLHVERIILLNGFFSEEKKLQTLPNGVIIGSLKQAIAVYPELVRNYMGSCLNNRQNGFQALNMALFHDGFFVYIPDHVTYEMPIQLLEIIQSKKKLFLHSRNLIYVGKNSRLHIIHCDDSYNKQSSFSNIVTEFFLDENAHVEHTKMQNLNDDSALVSLSYIRMEKEARFISNSIHFNGGLVRNHMEVHFNQPGSEAEISGLYILDKEQHVDNFIYIDHAQPYCTSRELFKGILDDHSSGVFNGHIYVNKEAKGTQAFQSNKNILITDKAKINSKPFLEIYNDEVKCSHGATIGQLDKEALFYLMSRGISERSARMLLMYAFCDDVLRKVEIESLRERLSDMVKKRLHGELTICDHCALHCSTPEYHLQLNFSDKASI